MTVLALAAVAVPASGAVAALLSTRADRALCGFLWVASVPALLLAVLGPPLELAIPWLGLGAELALDSLARAWLALAGTVWAVAGLTVPALVGDSTERGVRFASPFLATLAGAVLAALAADVVTFFIGFALVTYAAYPLVVHDGTHKAVRAGRIYLQFAVVGEAVLLAGLVTAVAGTATTRLDTLATQLAGAPGAGAAATLLLIGCGVKAGMLGVHMWLPLAHPAAPVPASAVLSGAIIKVGLLGWLRLLPTDGPELAGVGVVAIVVGVAGAFAGALLGTTQRDAKSLLAYSSVSQIGLMLTLVGIAVITATPGALAAAGLFAVHHGLAKAVLFLGVGVAHTTTDRLRTAVLAGQAFAALTLAGAPLTSGMAAKTVLKDLASQLWGPWGPVLDAVLPWTGAATTVLLGRLLWIQVSEAHAGSVPSAGRRRLLGGWMTALALTAGLAWAIGERWMPGVSLPVVTDVGVWWSQGWPVIVGLGLLTLMLRWAGLPSVPAGDLLVSVAAAHASLRRVARVTADALTAGLGQVAGGLRRAAGGTGRAAFRAQARAEHVLAHWSAAGTGTLVLLVALSAALVVG